MTTLSALIGTIRGACRRAACPTPARVPVRLNVLLAVLVLVSAGAATHQIRTWRFEKQLLQIAENIVMEANAADKNVPDLGNIGTHTTCDVFASSEYLFFGPVTGKIVFLIASRCSEEHSTEQLRLGCAICSGYATRELDYVYRRGNDGWVFQESYMCHAARPRR